MEEKERITKKEIKQETTNVEHVLCLELSCLVPEVKVDTRGEKIIKYNLVTTSKSPKQCFKR